MEAKKEAQAQQNARDFYQIKQMAKSDSANLSNLTNSQKEITVMSPLGIQGTQIGNGLKFINPS